MEYQSSSPMTDKKLERSERPAPAKMKRMPTALVTGANVGIGRAVALALGQAGYTVLVNYRGQERAAEATVKRIRQKGGTARAVQADVTDPADVERMFALVRKEYGRLDVLINNVGDYLRKDPGKLTPADVRRMTESNYYSVVECSLRAARLMRKQRSGRIINIGYVYAERVQANPAVAAYFCAKQAMMSFSLSLARHLARYKITVNIVSPGINVNSVEKPKRPSTLIPFGRLGQYSDIVNAVLFLLKPESEYITGTHLKVSGGHGL
jgi:3-oxoacyl-[acyl-carrier protein] reductase